ncbi:hypothetical protein ABZ591_33150, partial [Micromonospora fulviviridis]
VIVLDEPTAALGVKESNQVLRMIEEVRSRGLFRPRPDQRAATRPEGRRSGPAARPDRPGTTRGDRLDRSATPARRPSGHPDRAPMERSTRSSGRCAPGCSTR